MRVTKGNRTRNFILIVLIISCLAVAGFFGYKKLSSKKASENKPNTTQQTNYDQTPTVNEQQAGDAIKEQQPGPNDNTSTNSQPVQVVISDASVYDGVFEVRAFVSNRVENGGKCTFSLSKAGNANIVRESDALADASSTTCKSLSLPVSEFPEKGDWNLTVSYKSSSSNGSATKGVTIR